MRSGTKHKGATRMAEPRPFHMPWVGVWTVLVVLGTMMAVGWGAKQLLDPATLPINTVRIDTPLQQVSQEEIRQVVLAFADAGFLHFDVTAVRGELEALPWVRRARVRREWPDVLLVSVQEQQALARWAAGGLLSVHGERFDVADTTPWRHLPLLTGPAGTEKTVLGETRRIQAILRPLALPVSQVTLDERRAWSVQIDERLQLGLGRKEIERRLLRFVRVYPRVLEPRLAVIEGVDLRYTNGFAIRWRDGYSPNAA